MSAVYLARERFKLNPDAPFLGIGLPTRGKGIGCPEFWMSLFQMLPPMNVKCAYILQKGMLPAASRNSILENALERGMSYVLFLDDDVLFPDVACMRLWAQMAIHPEAAAISGIYTTKFDPPEPLLYATSGDGAFWDWSLGELVPIHSAGAGFMIVDLAYVKKLSRPYFQDSSEAHTEDGIRHRSHLGHDRYFLSRLTEEAGGQVYADTGLLLGHMDLNSDVVYVVPPEAPCFQRPPVGEAYVPYVDGEGCINWRRLIRRMDRPFKGYLDWLAEDAATKVVDSLIPVAL